MFVAEKIILHLLCGWVITILLSVQTINGQQSGYIPYNIQDDLPANQFIGNVVTDSNLTLRHPKEILQQLSYVFLTQGIHLDYFVLDELSGEIRTSQSVDRDDICTGAEQCALRLDIAVQPSKYFEILKVVVTINDRNDNSPSFSQSSVFYQFSESTSPGVPLIPIELASDIDSPKYGVVNYRLQSETDVFGLDVKNSSGTFEVHLTLKKQLDREVENEYKLLLLAKDGGNPSKTGTLTINIQVLDINDNNPKFESSTHEVNIPENLTPGTQIITINATDADIGENGKILYSFNQQTLMDAGDIFTIERVTGMIYLQKALDYETRKTYSLIIVAQDQGSNSLPANTRVLVNVNDINDNNPIIIINALADGSKVDEKVAKIVENTPPEVFVAHITIHDDDQGNNGHVECFLSESLSEAESKFQIVEIYDREFKVVTTKILDREIQAKYELHIKCKDYGTPQLTAEEIINVEVLDLNDNIPEFSQEEYHVVLQEHNKIGTLLIKVNAVDMDSGNNGKITFAVDQSVSHLFEINSQTGEIKANSVFDRELISQKVFQVIATDNGDEPKSSSAKVIMDILDIDDQVPKFTKHKYKMTVLENMPALTDVGFVEAIDADAPQHNRFTYYLEAHRSAIDCFTIDSLTGKVATKRELDREKQDSYKLFVQVQSDSSPNRGDTAEVEISVLDKNDNKPVFIFPSLTENTTIISNKAHVGHVITRVVAHDTDVKQNSELIYSIVESSNKNQYFKIDHISGELTVHKDISHLQPSKLFLKLLVKDNGNPEQITFGTLYLIIDSSVSSLIPRNPLDPKSVKINSMSGDLLAVIVGCVCGAVVIILAVILTIVIFMRKKKQSSANQVSWYTTNPSTTHSIDDLMVVGTNECCDSLNKLESDNSEDNSHDLPQNSSEKFISPSPLISTNIFCDRDNDSGYADLSHGSNDDHTQCRTAVVQNMADDMSQMLNRKTNGNIRQTPRSDITKHAVNTNSRPYIEPIPPLSQHHSLSPSQQQSFAEWLNSEGQHLKKQGHTYRVSNNKLPSSKSPSLQLRSGSVKKTVRFTEPESPPEAIFASNPNCPVLQEDFSYNNFLQDVKPSKSDGSIYNKNIMYQNAGPYGSLDRGRYNTSQIGHTAPVIILDHSDKYNQCDNNDGSLV